MDGAVPQFDPPNFLYIKLDMRTASRDIVVTTRKHTFDSGLLSITVPEDFRCDLGSLPWFYYLFVSPYGRAQRGFLFHDVLYKTQNCSRYLSDVCLRVIHRADGIWWWQRILVFWALRTCAWWAWRKNRANRNKFRLYMLKSGGGVQ